MCHGGGRKLIIWVLYLWHVILKIFTIELDQNSVTDLRVFKRKNTSVNSCVRVGGKNRPTVWDSVTWRRDFRGPNRWSIGPRRRHGALGDFNKFNRLDCGRTGRNGRGRVSLMLLPRSGVNGGWGVGGTGWVTKSSLGRRTRHKRVPLDTHIVVTI